MSLTGAILAAAVLAAQGAEAAAPPAPVAPADQGVSVYPPAFFAEAQPVTALDMVQRLPGFTIDLGLAVRGLAGANGNILIDGQPPVTKNDGLEEILKRIPASSVARIELIRGSAPGIDMQGKTVLANVIRKSAAGFQGAVSVSGTWLYDGRFNPGTRLEGQWRWNGRLLELSYLGGRGPDDWWGEGPRIRYDATGAVIVRSEVDSDFDGTREWLTGAFETPAAGGKLRINGALLFNPASGEMYDRYSLGGARDYEYDRIERRTIELGGRYERRLGERTTAEAEALQQWNDRETSVHFETVSFSRDFLLERETSETVGRVTLKRSQTDKLSFEMAGEGALNSLESQTALAQNGAAVFLPAANVRVEEKRGEVSGLATWRPWQALTLEAAVRQEFSTITSSGDVTLKNSFRFTKPRLSLTWAPSEAGQVRLRIEREVIQLSFDDFVANSNSISTGGAFQAGNPDLTPQQNWIYEAAFERRFWKSGAVVITLRHQEHSDVIDRVPIYDAAGLAVADAPGNIGDGSRNAILGTLTLPLDRLGAPHGLLRLEGGWRKTKVTDPVTGATREISYVNPTNWDAHFTQDLPAWKTTWGADVSSAFRQRSFGLSEITTFKVDTWVTLFADIKPRRDFVIRLELQNVTARDVERIREVYAGPRSLGVLAYTDVRQLRFGRGYFIRLRKSFG